MQTIAQAKREEVQDIWYGQLVTFVARWFLIAAGLVLTFWRATSVSEAVTPTYLLIGLIAMNFLLHGRFVVGEPMRKEVVLAGCLIDAVIISLVIILTPWGAGRGIDNPFYIFYYPVLLAFALVFPLRLTLLFSAGIITAYGAIVLLSVPGSFLDQSTLEPVVARLVTLASTAILGNMYWRIQRQWRQSQLALD